MGIHDTKEILFPIDHMSPAVSPMIAAGRVIKALNENAKVVFIGPVLLKE